MRGILQLVSNALGGEANPTLCASCRPLFRGQRVDKPLGVTSTAILRQDFPQFEAGVRNGCGLCRLRWSQLTPEQRVELRPCRKITYGFWESRVGDGVAFEYWLDDKNNGTKPWVTTSIKLKKKDDVPASFLADVPVETSTGSHATIEAARRWLWQCDSSHTDCQRWIHRSAEFRPTRLIDIGADAADSPRICEGASLGAGEFYVTLSHCWGGVVPLQLKKENHSLFKTALPEGIPKTFAEAMQVTRAIGVRYIWIDSLCIIQDSVEDWQKEASLMGRIYEHTWCNIAATKANNSSEGLYSDRDTQTVRPVEVQARWGWRPSVTYYLWDPSHWTDNVDDARLLHRGWVTQERILAPRILHFAQGQLFWECCSLRASETFPDGIPDNTSFKASLDTKKLTTGIIEYHTPALQRYALWQMYVYMYTDGSLSMATKDKLLAISALARKIGPPDDYVAGLWKPILTRQLRWQVGKNCTRQREWRAPSWSWASIDGPIFAETQYEGSTESTRTLFDILDIDVKLATADPYGPITGGTLKLTASIIRATAFKSDCHPNPDCWWLGDIHAHVKLDVEIIQEEENLFCMPLHATIGQNSQVYGIVLDPTDGPGIFRRRGVFYVSNNDSSDRWVERLGDLAKIGSETQEFGPFVSRLESIGWKQYGTTLI